jgi:hypothetical protein
LYDGLTNPARRDKEWQNQDSAKQQHCAKPNQHQVKEKYLAKPDTAFHDNYQTTMANKEWPSKYRRSIYKGIWTCTPASVRGLATKEPRRRKPDIFCIAAIGKMGEKVAAL